MAIPPGSATVYNKGALSTDLRRMNVPIDIVNIPSVKYRGHCKKTQDQNINLIKPTEGPICPAIHHTHILATVPRAAPQAALTLHQNVYYLVTLLR